MFCGFFEFDKEKRIAMKRILTRMYAYISGLWYRMRLKNEDFSIITNSCIGGVMYHKLKKRFLSPTINLWMYDKDFLRFVAHLKEYVDKELVFVDGSEKTPVAWLGDVKIHFNHARTKEEAARDWEKRKGRINYDNLFIIMSDRPGSDNLTEDVDLSDEDIKGLEAIPCKGKVVFSVRKISNVDYIVPLRRDEEGDYVNMYMNDKVRCLGRWRWEGAWDWVYWLNTGKVKRP